MSHVFLSYTRRDTKIMRRVRGDLRAEGIVVWTDEGIEPGSQSWKLEIENAIRVAGCITCILSPDAVKSRWVREELNFAETQKKPILLLLARGDETNAVPFGFTEHQWIDIRRGYDKEIEGLVNAVASYLSHHEHQGEKTPLSATSISNLGIDLISSFVNQNPFLFRVTFFAAVFMASFYRSQGKRENYPQEAAKEFVALHATLADSIDHYLEVLTGLGIMEEDSHRRPSAIIRERNGVFKAVVDNIKEVFGRSPYEFASVIDNLFDPSSLHHQSFTSDVMEIWQNHSNDDNLIIRQLQEPNNYVLTNSSSSPDWQVFLHITEETNLTGVVEALATESTIIKPQRSSRDNIPLIRVCCAPRFERKVCEEPLNMMLWDAVTIWQMKHLMQKGQAALNIIENLPRFLGHEYGLFSVERGFSDLGSFLVF